MKSLGRAATLHHLSQSAASTAVRRVEAAFGTSLCLHEKRQFRLSREGEELFPRLDKWIKELKDLIITKEQTPIRLVTTRAIGQIAFPALFAVDHMDFIHMRPDKAYAAILHGEADVALVLDNAPWKGVIAAEVGKGSFQLYAKEKAPRLKPILLPEDQMEVLALGQSFKAVHGYSIPVKARIPSWSMIATICSTSNEVGFLPDFLAKKCKLEPVLWQPATSSYRVLAIYRKQPEKMQKRIDDLVEKLCEAFAD